MFKRNLLIFCCLFSMASGLHAQQYFSPFSRYGIGDLQSQSFARYKAMGDASVAAINDNMFTVANPASYAPVHSFSFEAGVNGSLNWLRADTQSYKYSDASIPYLSLALPSTDTSRNWGFSLGLLPFSRTGYNLRSTFDTPIRNVQLINAVGQTSRFFIGTGFQLLRNFYIGANASYIFGNTNIIHSVNFPDSSDVNGAQQIAHINVSDFLFDAGAIYTAKFAKSRSLNFGISASLPRNLKSRMSSSLNELTTRQSGFIFQDSVFNGDDIHFTNYMPLVINGGINYNYSDTWHVYADFKYSGWSHIPGVSNIYSMSVGFEYMPGSDITASKLSSYLGRVHYRAGFHYQTGFYSSDFSIPQQWFASVGLGLPASKYTPNESNSSFVDLAIQYGRRSANLPSSIRQDCLMLTLGIHLFEPYWFQRPKID
jgi:hypothetical protein